MFVQDLDLNSIDTKKCWQKEKQLGDNFFFLEPICCY